MAIIRSDFRISFIAETLNDVFFQRSNMYYFLGRVEPWTVETSPDLISTNTLANDNEIRNNIVYMRRVTGNDVSLVASNYQWEPNTVYDQWDHTVDMTSKAFYVTTDEFHVFKCLDNVEGALSTVKPTKPINNFSAPFKTADGYTWKFMYSIPEFKRSKFLSRGFVPVQRALTDSFYSRGAIEQVVVVDPGSGYEVEGLPAVTVTGGSPSRPATFQLVVGTRDTISGTILAVIITDPGAGYTSAPTLTVGGSGTGIWGPTAVLRAIVNGGEVVNVTIEDPGQGYGGAVPTITVTGNGTGASFAPVVTDGRITDVIVVNPGQNYTSAAFAITPIPTQVNPPEPARLQAVLSASDFLSDQSIVEQSAVVGAIYSIKVTNGGNNYNPATVSVNIQGDGTGASATASVEGGVIQRVTITNPGSGYTYATVTFVDSSRELLQNNIEATAYAVLPPNAGHGVDAVRELNADTMCVFTLLGDDLQLNALNQEYRQYGLLINPTDRITGKLVTLDRNFLTFDVEFNDVTNLDPDTVLINNNKRYRVIAITPGNPNVVKLLQMNPVYGDPNIGLPFINEGNASVSYEAARVVSSPTVNKYSGYLICAANEAPFAPSDTQSIATRTFIKL